jgi:translocation and assembly module TamB
MKRTGRHPIWSWVIHTPWVLATLGILAVLGFFGSGAGNPLIKQLILRRIEAVTGGKAEIRALSIRWLSLRATVKGLVIHGKEPAGTEPLMAVDEVEAGLRVDSFWGRRVSLDELTIKKPRIHIRVEPNGSTNVPTPARPNPPQKPLQELLFDLRARHVAITDGGLLYNDIRTPLALEGGELQFALTAGGSMDRPLYIGNVDWQGIRFTALRYVPLPISVSAKFTVWREGFTLEQGVFGVGRSHLDAQAELNGFANPRLGYRYRGWVELLDVREILREPQVPTGRVNIRGEGAFGDGKASGTGSYSTENLALYYKEFHASGLISHASYRLDEHSLELTDFVAAAMSGTVKGKVTLRYSGMQFRAVTHVEGFRLAQVFPAMEHRGFPIDELHWDGILSADTVETWTNAFRKFEITANMHWDAPSAPYPNHQPVTADCELRYQDEAGILTIRSGEFGMPSSRLSISGVLAPRNTDLELKFETAAIETYRDFIHRLEGVSADSKEGQTILSGGVRWDGRITGASSRPTFAGHTRGERVRYDGIALDALEGDLTYSPSVLSFKRGRAQRGDTNAAIEADLALTDWSFLPENQWTAEINLEQAPLASLQQLAGTSYPVLGKITGQFHGHGTRSAPTLTGLFDLAEGDIYGVTFHRLRGQLSVQPDEARISNAELRFFDPGKESGQGAGIITGSAAYRYGDQNLTAELVGAALPLENFEKLQMRRLPIGGQVSFKAKVNGPLRTPQAEGTLRVVDLRIGQDVVGSFDGNLTSDGRVAHLEVKSAMTTGDISGGLTLTLGDPYALSGKISIRNIDLDPFLMTAMHVQKFSGHGVADGDISVNGSLKQPENIVVDANFSRLALNYANVALVNEGPVRFRSSQQSLEIDTVKFKGTDTNLQIEGVIRFTGRRTIGLRLNGAVDLRLLSGFFPDFDLRGPAQINAAVEGIIERPRITGRVHLENASARSLDFPTGLSAIKGDIIFDATRLFFNDVTAEAGGGTLRLSGGVNYAETLLRYDVSLRTDRARIRYPEGMSWLVGGNLRFAGTTQSAVLSGRVTVERVTLNGGLEVAASLVSSKQGINGPSTGSPFLRNLHFDIEAGSAPEARLEWPNAELRAEANLRVRGTWEHPIILGHIHVMSGDLYFAGNRYRVTRGDVNFANPFRLDPVMNVEATTTVQQYEITLNFNGPSSKLSLAYRSDPPLPANDIITLLAMGQTSTESATRSGGTSGSSAGATALLSEAISSQVGGRIEKLFGITRLRIDPGLAGVGSTGASQNAAARVTVEQQIAHNLTITYVSNVGSTQQQVIQVEYIVTRSISIVALRDQNGTFGIDVKIKKRFP